MKNVLLTAAKSAISTSIAMACVGASAQDCRQIAEPAKRLECYDNALSKPEVAQPQGEEADIQAAVRKALKDPGSAQFGDVLIVTPERACQTVNAKNQFGGYTGSQQAILTKVGGMWFTLGIQAVSQQRCVEIVKRIK